MKNIISFLIFFVAFEGSSQSFQGRLEYLVTTEILGDSLINGVCKTSLIEKLKSQGEIPVDTLTYLYSKNGNYVSTSKYKGVDIINTYLKKDNLLYRFIGDLNTISAIDVTIDLEEKFGNVPIVKKTDQKQKVGDLDCFVVEVVWKTGIYRYYYSENTLNINPELFKSYNYDQFYKFLNISKSLPIKIEKQTNNFYKSTYELYSYTKEDIDEDIFILPKMKENKNMSNIYPNKRFFVIK